jgi:enterobacterial common antigen flippase
MSPLPTVALEARAVIATSMPHDPSDVQARVTPSQDDADAPDRSNSSYSQILRTSALIGTSSAVNIAIGIARTKAMAVLLGPGGFGLMGAFTTIADLVWGVAGMGINKSGVRQIAASVGQNDASAIARTTAVLRRTAIVLGVLGAALLVVLAQPVAEVTFGTAEHAGAVALLSLAVFFRLVADGQGALLQGMRRIGELARAGVLGNLFGSVAGIALVYALGERGVVLALIALAAASAASLWWCSRRVRLEPGTMQATQLCREAAELLRLGLAFMASGLLMMGVAYIVRITLINHHGLGGAGLYQAAWTLGGMYVGIVLQAMGADFYPRLVAAAGDDEASNRLVNEQALVSLLLAGVGVLATLVYAPLVISLFYSGEFTAATETLRWICLGMMLRVISWPMGFIIVARNEQRLYFVTETAWALVSVALAWLLVPAWGLRGAGVAFFASYVFHATMIYPIVRRLSGFRWSPTNLKVSALVLVTVAAVFSAPYLLPPLGAMAIGSLLLLLFGLFALRTLVALVPQASVPKRLHSILGPLLRRVTDKSR